MKKGILFDLDGTLLDTLGDLTGAVNHTMDLYGCPHRTMEEVRSFLGSGAYKLIELSLPGRETDPPVEEALANYKQYYREHSQITTRPYEGILQALNELKETYTVAVVSNKPDAATKILCAYHFGEIYARGEMADCPRKPAPDMIYAAMKDLGLDNCIYVGDSDVDVHTAKNAGVPCLSVTWGFRDEADLVAAGATHFCHVPADLPACIAAMEEENGQ